MRTVDRSPDGPATAGASDAPRSRFRTVASETLATQVGRQLIVGILRGDFEPGEDIPSEDRLAREFGVSRPVVREAVKHLSVLGLVESRQGRQTRVAPYESWNHFAPEILSARREVGAVEDVLLELLELRRMIEVEAAALAAARATTTDLEAMDAALSVLDGSLDDPRGFAQGDIAFHDTILRATRNHLVPRLFDVLRPLLEFGREISVATRPHGPHVSQEGHRAVFEAIRAGSAVDARRRMEEHLSWTADLDFSERQTRLALDRARGGAATTRDPSTRDG
ncbi:MAG: FCD domain-containing protein [Candidatus Limnocylindrales bacterium]